MRNSKKCLAQGAESERIEENSVAAIMPSSVVFFACKFPVLTPESDTVRAQTERGSKKTEGSEMCHRR